MSLYKKKMIIYLKHKYKSKGQKFLFMMLLLFHMLCNSNAGLFIYRLLRGHIYKKMGWHPFHQMLLTFSTTDWKHDNLIPIARLLWHSFLLEALQGQSLSISKARNNLLGMICPLTWEIQHSVLATDILQSTQLQKLAPNALPLREKYSLLRLSHQIPWYMSVSEEWENWIS